MPRTITRTLYSWAEIYGLPPAVKLTDSSGTDYWTVGNGKIIDDTANFVSYGALELPVTTEQKADPTRPHVYRQFGGRYWNVRAGRELHETRRTWDEAIELANKLARK